MKDLFCEVLLQYFPSTFDVQELHSTYVANCIFNTFLSYTAITVNIGTIYAMRKTSSFPKTLKTLLLSLAVSDVGVGLLCQPFYTSLLVKLLRHINLTCDTYKIFLVITTSFSMTSLLGVVAVSVDRFLAVHLHLRYQELVTHKRVVAVVISIWLLCTWLPALTRLWVPPHVNTLATMVVVVVGLLLTTLTYGKLYLTVRRHKNQIQSLQLQQVAQPGDMTNAVSAIKTAVGIFYVYLLFLVCYLPFFVCLVAITINGPSVSLKRCYHFSLTLVFLNSSLNPLIYCWKMRHIRHAMMDILRNMSWKRNHQPQ